MGKTVRYTVNSGASRIILEAFASGRKSLPDTVGFHTTHEPTGSKRHRSFELTKVEVSEDGLGYNIEGTGAGNCTFVGYYDPMIMSEERGWMDVFLPNLEKE